MNEPFRLAGAGVLWLGEIHLPDILGDWAEPEKGSATQEPEGTPHPSPLKPGGWPGLRVTAQP
jgi:hypothetical protein